MVVESGVRYRIEYMERERDKHQIEQVTRLVKTLRLFVKYIEV